jgi:hypothetical protein
MVKRNSPKVDKLKGTPGFMFRPGEPYGQMLEDLMSVNVRNKHDVLRWLILQAWNLMTADRQRGDEPEVTSEIRQQTPGQ